MDIDTIRKQVRERRENEGTDVFVAGLGAVKKEALKKGDDSLAKEIFCLEEVLKAKVLYETAFKELKQERYYDGWCTLEEVELVLHFLSPHFDSRFSEYGLLFIQEHVSKLQALFPYKLFMSTEFVEKEKRCSICNQVVSLRKPCGHRTGEVYQGEMCHRVVTSLEIMGVALVEKPVHKYAVPFLSDGKNGKPIDQYDYSLLRYLVKRLSSPYDSWNVDWEKRRHPHSLFRNYGRNDPCPCESGQKYKKCCLINNEGVLRPHCQFTFEKDPPAGLMTIEYAGYD